MIVFTVTAKKAGTISTIPSVAYTDNGGSKTVSASTSSLLINKDIRTSYSDSVSKTKMKKGSYFYITLKMKNSGLDTSGVYTVQNKLSSAFKKVSTSQTSSFKYSANKWTGKIGSNKTIVLKMKTQITSSNQRQNNKDVHRQRNLITDS